MERLKNSLVYAFLFLLPWQTRLILRPGELNNGYWEYGTISIYATEIILLIALILYIAIKLKKNSQSSILNFQLRKNSRFQILDSSFMPLLFAICYLLVISLQAVLPWLHLYYLLRIAEALGLCFLIKSVDRNKAFWAFILGIMPQAILGIYQFLTQNLFASKWLGMALHNSSALGTFVIETGSGRWLRAYGGLPHPNILGGYLVIAILMLLAHDSRLTTHNHKFKNTLFVVSRLLLVVYSAALFFTFSRSAWLSLLVGIVALAFQATRRKATFSNSLLIILIFLSLSLIFKDPFLARIEGRGRLETKSNIERISGLKESWELIKKHPFFGVGLQNYTYATWKEIDSSRPVYAYEPVHNIFVLRFVEIGLIGLFFALWVIFKIRPPLYAFIIIATLGFFDHYLITLYPGMMLFGSTLGFIKRN